MRSKLLTLPERNIAKSNAEFYIEKAERLREEILAASIISLITDKIQRLNGERDGT
jgi:hypothetical protein